MIAAEKWYENQVRYQKYGLDMRPASEMERTQRTKPAGAAAISWKEKAGLMLLIFVIGLLLLGTIATTAYASKIQYDINKLTAQSDALEGEIENLKVEIESAANIRTVEQKATERLGMVYPAAYEMVYLREDGDAGENFAAMLKQQAYN